MTKNFATRALMIVGLMVAGTMASFAQTVAVERRVASGKENLQPVAVSAVAMTSLNLTADQRARISAIDGQATALTAERARLWSEYNALVARPDFSDALAADEAAPRMLRIVAINKQLASVVARQESQVNAILTPAQRIDASKAVSQVRASFTN